MSYQDKLSADHRVKRIEWAYPSSENAVTFGFGKTGGWTVMG